MADEPTATLTQAHRYKGFFDTVIARQDLSIPLTVSIDLAATSSADICSTTGLRGSNR